jgi:hypothetical protein
MTNQLDSYHVKNARVERLVGIMLLSFKSSTVLLYNRGMCPYSHPHAFKTITRLAMYPTTKLVFKNTINATLFPH